MKKILLLLLLASGLASAQIVTIPDARFKAELIDNDVDTNSDGEIQVTEALATLSLSIVDFDITDFTGLEAFVNLDTLNIIGPNILSLDLTSNVNLTHLSFQDTAISPLTSIDLSACILLEELILQDTSITSLDLSTNYN